MIRRVAARLRDEAAGVDERRLLVLAGDRAAGLEAAGAVLAATDLRGEAAVLVSHRPGLGLETVAPDEAGTLLGASFDAVVLDAHDGLDPNVLGRTVGTVRGGGLYVLLAPALDAWPAERDPFDETLAVPPFAVDDVGGRFRRRFVDTLRAHPGIAIVDVDRGEGVRDGLTDPAPRVERPAPRPPSDPVFPADAYEACLTRDQVEALRALEGLVDPGTAVVVEADRGRGKSSVAGLAAASLALAGDDVAVTAPSFRNAVPAFERAHALLAGDAPADGAPPREITTPAGGRVRFLAPSTAVASDPDVLVVDEAATLPVDRLAGFLAVDRLAFTTTVHGYEGTGRGFAVRFRDRLDASGLEVVDVTLADPIRYAAGDPIEVWSFRALLLDAAPAVDPVVADARPATVRYRRLGPDELLADESLLREAFGLLVLAHYRTEPADLARLLDAPNVSVRALLHDGHVASVALLAREGDLPAALRAEMYEGGRVRGNMLPDILTSQLRDEAAGTLTGVRVMRIATHAAVRSRGLGSALLDGVRDEFAGDVDWLGAGYGATPRLLRFWDRNGFGTVHLSTTRNASSGEHSAIMLAPTSDDGAALHRRHARWFVARLPAVLADSLRDVDPDVVRAALAATDVDHRPGLSDEDWRRVAAMAYGPGLLDVDPRPFRRLAARALVDADLPGLSPREQRLLVERVLQARDWDAVAADLGFPSRRTCMRAIGDAFKPIVDAYGTETALAERDRFVD